MADEMTTLHLTCEKCKKEHVVTKKAGICMMPLTCECGNKVPVGCD